VSKPLVVMADAERVIVDYLTTQLAARDDVDDATVGAAIPDGWTEADPPHVLVALDAADVTYPIRARCTVRLTTWAQSTTDAKRICQLAMSLCLVHPGDADVWSVVPLLGVRPAQDPDTGSPIATCAVAVSVRPSAAD